MPSYTTLVSDGLTMKSNTTAIDVDESLFWVAIDLVNTPRGFETTRLTCAADQLEQTIVDISGSGVLTHVVCPELSGSGTMTVRVTIDGAVKTFISETISTGNRFCIGHIFGFGAEGVAGNGGGFGGAKDSGFSLIKTEALLPTPLQTLSYGGVGMTFRTGLKVTIQGSANISATAYLEDSCANYSLFIPEGL